MSVIARLSHEYMSLKAQGKSPTELVLSKGDYKALSKELEALLRRSSLPKVPRPGLVFMGLPVKMDRQEKTN